MGNVISAIVSGLVVGLLARWFYPGAVPMGTVVTILLGVGGSLAAGLAIAASTNGISNGISRAGWIASILGAMALIFIGRQMGWG